MDEHVHQRRTDDLTTNEWRLLQLERRAEMAVDRVSFNDFRNAMSEEVRTLRETTEKISGRIDSLRVWVLTTALGICGVVLSAAEFMKK